MSVARSRTRRLRFAGLAMLVGCVMNSALAGHSYDFSEVERTATEAVERRAVPSIAVAIARDGEVLYERAFGLADLEAGTAATVRTAYALASATKPITATALMALFEQQQLDLSAPVERYLERLRFRTVSGEFRPVSLLQLLSHTSGLGTYARIHYGKAIPGRSLDAELQGYGRLLHEPGRVAEYSNLGYGVVGQFIEHRSGQTLSDAINETVFRPLQMHDAFIGAPAARHARVAVGYDAALVRLPKLHNNTPGAGNAFASVRDLLRFGMFHLQQDESTPRIPSRESRARMQANATPQALHHYYGAAYYGLGWYVRPDGAGQRVVWHEGGMPGASSLILLLPDQGIVVAVLNNRTDANELAQTIADELIRAVIPTHSAIAFNPVAGYRPYAGEAEFRGRWAGTINVDGVFLTCTLTLDSHGNGQIRYADASGKDFESDLRAMVNGDSFVSGFAGRLPAKDIASDDQPLLLLKLVRSGDQLTGSLVAYASPARLEYLLPFALSLARDDEGNGK